MRFAISTPNFDDYGDPRLMMELAHEAEEAGWDGFFIWDHMLWTSPRNRPVADPYVLLAAMASVTRTIKLGPAITPIPRRPPWILAREAVTLDHLSGGRLILGVGIGGDWFGDYSTVDLPADDRTHAAMLDEGLQVVTGLWGGEPFSFEGEHYRIRDATFIPKPVQQPRIPIWVAGYWPRKRPFRRAAQWDGVLPGATDDHRLTPDEYREIGAYIREYRTSEAPFDMLHGDWLERKDSARDAEIVASYAEAGVTWWSEANALDKPFSELRDRIRLGPPK